MKAKLVDLIIPLVLIMGSMCLLCLGIDGEVKTILALAAGWAFKVVVTKK
ncbi:unnamed protein product [marine sediment metagenome]|uniref:Uncharacterized protein n=1 Tax=marine sediment metagenome TaxID=412755 RepID=X1UR93_9ZZZZ